MRTYGSRELVQFLEAVDQALTHRTETIIIGGSAAALAYEVTRATHDIDTWSAVDKRLQSALKQARRTTGLNIPLERSAIADAPYDFETRLEHILPSLRHLLVWVPEKHDLTLMKILRCYEHDLQAIDEIHRHSPLDLETLVDRYEREMGAVVGDRTRLRRNLLTLIERLFPDDVARIERRLTATKR